MESVESMVASRTTLAWKYTPVKAHSGNPYWRGRLSSTTYLLTKIACFVKKEKKIFRIKSSCSEQVSFREVNCTWSFLFSKNSLSHLSGVYRSKKTVRIVGIVAASIWNDSTVSVEIVLLNGFKLVCEPLHTCENIEWKPAAAICKDRKFSF